MSVNINYTTGGTNVTYFLDSCSCSSTDSKYVIRYYNHIAGVLVAVPASWFPNDKESPLPDEFARLINEDTNTGWKIGGCLKTLREYPPGISRVTLSEFKKMILETANTADAKRINEWFSANVEGAA